MRIVRTLLWIDGASGATAGALTLSLAGRLHVWYRIDLNLILLIGAANLLYGCYALGLAARKSRPRPSVLLLIAANLAWSVACFRWAVLLADSATCWGLAHLIGEGTYVAVLACLEWRWRDELCS